MNTWHQLYREILSGMKATNPTQPLWRSGSQRVWARAEANRRYEKLLASADSGKT
jgi:hypothetical protein